MILNSKFKILSENNSHNTYCYEVDMNKPFITYTAQVEKLTNEKQLIVTGDNIPKKHQLLWINWWL